MEKVLLVEDELREQRAMAAFLRHRGYEVLVAADSEAGSQLLAQIPDIVVTDLKLAGGDGMGVLREVHQALPETPVIIITGHGTIASAVQAMKEGAFDYLIKPVNPEELLLVIQRAAERSHLQREVRRLRKQVAERGGLLGMVGNSEPMRRIFVEHVQMVAPTRNTVLVTGESGTGKELVAWALYHLSLRKDGPFVALNSAAIPKNLAESELFGHGKEAFTGATDRRLGKFAAADRGTLLIDEIGEMELPVQAKLLRTFETHTVSPVGSNEEQPVDVRAVASTHRDLRSLVQKGTFREDLYYLLHVVHIDVPPLRQRREDIPLLVATFLQQLNQEHGRKVEKVAPAAMDALQGYPWPGNVRELRNLVEEIVVLSQKEGLDLADLSPDFQGSTARETVPPFRPGLTLAELEREAIQRCLVQAGGNRQETANILGISTRTLLRKIRRYGLQDPRRPADPILDESLPSTLR